MSHAGRAVDAVVVGSGPNGLTAAIELARAGRSVTVLEANAEIGGGIRSAELTLPGFVHDVCSAVHPFGRTSPAFRDLGLERHGLRWLEAPIALGHPLDDGTAVLLERDVDATAARLGPDRDAYLRLLGPLVRGWDALLPELLAPFHVPLSPRRSVALAAFGLRAVPPATLLVRGFRGEPARALIAGVAAHSILRLTEPVSAAAALVMLASAHRDGWPFPAGGAGSLAAALAAEIEALGGTIQLARPVATLGDLPRHRVALFDTSPGALAAIAADRLPPRFRRRLRRFRHGPGVFKLDLALDGPIPWRAPGLELAGTVHLGGTFEEIAAAEAAVHDARLSQRPFVLLAQPSPFDPSRAPAGRHVAWAYCHVPNGSEADMTEPILDQVERFAPGVRGRILAISARGPAALEAANGNDVGGDIAGGRNDLGQLFTRPSLRLFDPYSTPDPALFLCSASTPPGGGVHGMCGLHAARSALRRLER